MMVNDVLSPIVPIVDVNQFPINILGVDKGGTIMLLATFTRNGQSATASLSLLFLNCTDSMFILFAKLWPNDASIYPNKCQHCWTFAGHCWPLLDVGWPNEPNISTQHLSAYHSNSTKSRST